MSDVIAQQWLDRVLGQYRIQLEIGCGRTGMVFLAEDVRSREKAAVKIVGPGAAEAALASARVLQQITHVNVARVFDCGMENKHAWIALEYVTFHSEATPASGTRMFAKNLSEYVLGRTALLDEREVAAILQQVLEALQCVHASTHGSCGYGGLHPHNVLLEQTTDSSLRVRLTDLGVSANRARRAAADAYLSPEELQGQTPTMRSDVYALGALTYFMLTGNAPPSPLVRPSQLREQCQPAWDEFVQRALCYEPERRFSSYHAVRDKLQQIAADIKKPWFKVFMKIVYYTNVFIGLLVLAVALIVLIWYLRRDHRPGGPPEFELVDETTHHLGTPPLPEPLLDGSHGVVAIDPAAVTTTPPVLTHPPMATAASTADLLDTSASIGLGAEVEEAAAPATPAAEQPAIATPVEAAEDDPETAASPEMTAASSEPPQTPMTATPSTPPVVVVHDEPAAPAAAAPESTPVMTEYIVQRKDTLWSIARQHHMTLTALCEANNIELNAVLQIGQRLRVNAMPSAPGAAATATAASAWVPYKVRAGDTYYSLARTLHCDMHMLMATNAQQELRTGQSILVPSGTP